MSIACKALCLLSILVLAVFPAGAPGAAALAPLPAANVLDSTFAPFFASRAAVRGILPLAGGKVLIYGDITTANGQARSRVAILNADGSLDPGFQYSSDLTDDYIYTMIAVSGGKFLVGGNMLWFSDTKVQRYLFRLNSDGSLDPTFDASHVQSGQPNFGLEGPVTDLALDKNGKILAGGDFVSPYNHIARLTEDGAIDPAFNPGSGANGRVSQIAVQPVSGKIILAGAFSQFNGTPTGGIARLDASGAFDSAFFGAGVSGESFCGSVASGVSALAVQANDDVLVGGGFSTIKGVSAPQLARVKANGTVDTAFAPFIRYHLEEVTSLLSAGSQIVVGGWNPVLCLNNYPTDHEAQVYVLGSTDGSFVSYMPFKGKNTDVYALAQRTDNKIVAGGSFTQTDDPVNPQYFAGLFQFTLKPFSVDFSYAPIVGGQAEVTGLAVQDDGRILASGSFYRTGSSVNNGLARLTTSGALDTGFVPVGSGFTAVAVRSDQKIVAAGAGFTNDVYPPNLALLNANGSVFASHTFGWTPNSVVPQPDNRVVATTTGQPGLFQLNADLTEDATFSAKRGSGISNFQQPDLEFDRANVAALQGDAIIVGGSFSTFSGLAHQNLVRLGADGKIDAGFVSPAFTVMNFRSEVFALAVQPDGKILVGGRFSIVGGAANPSLARLKPDGSLDTSFHSPILDSGANVYALAVQPDGKILAGGDFQVMDGSIFYTGLVRLNPDGSRDPTFTASVNIHGVVKSLAFVLPNQVLIGGSFSAIDGQPRQGLARYLVDMATAALGANFAAGAPGSFFTFTGQHFFPNTVLQIVVNGHSLGSVQTAADGSAVFILQAPAGNAGLYCVRLLQSEYGASASAAGVSTSASFWINVNPAAPQRAKAGSGTALSIPSGIAYRQFFIPIIRR
jgi:uncharacterized delta-60 repeat protein